MKKTIKYLDNDGNYQYATVKDAGDLDKLKTKAKEDLVSAINELATNGIGGGGIDDLNTKVDQLQQQVNQNADALNMTDQERQEMQQQIAQMQAEVRDKVAELQKLAEEQKKKLDEASEELQKKANAIDVQQMQEDNAQALKEKSEALENSLKATNDSLEKTADHLNEMEIQAGVIETSVKQLQNGFESKVSSADFNEARTKIQEQETMVKQLNNELSTKASNSELNTVTQRVQNAESLIKQNADGIKASVTKETMYKEMDDFSKYRENRLNYTRDFSNNWALNGNDIVDDDHLYDVQHDVKSVSIKNGAYLIQTTDLDVEDMSKTFTFAMWVEKGKKPRVYYGSAELTNMQVKEDKGDYQRVYWTFVPTIVKQQIRITGDTSTQGNLIVAEPKLEQSDRPSAWSTNTNDQYATTEKLSHDLKLTADKLESSITKQSQFEDRQQQDESRITQTEHGVEVANQTIIDKTNGLRQEFDGRINATSKELTTEYKSFTNQAIGQMADGGSNLILNSSFASMKNSFDKWQNVSPKVRIAEDSNHLKWVHMNQTGLTANSPIGLTSNYFRVKKGFVTVAMDIKSDNASSIDNDNILILESYNSSQQRVFSQEIGFSALKITKETLFDHGPHRVVYKYNQTRDDTQYMAVHVVLPKNGDLYVTNVLARTVANGEDAGEYTQNANDLQDQIVEQRTRIEQNDQSIALKADQTKVTQDINAAKSDLTGKISTVEQRAASLEVKADGISSSVSTLSKTVDGISVGGRNYLRNSDKSTSGRIQDLGTMPNEVLNSLAGKTITVSADVEWSNFVSASGVQNRLGFEISAHRSDGKDQWFGTWAWPTTSNGKKRISTTFDVPAGLTYTVSNNGQNGYVSIKGTGTVSHAKVEVGNKPTDWSPAPEDTDADISALQSRASRLEQTDSEIKATVTSVTNDLKNGRGTLKEGILSMTDDHFSTKFSSIDNKIDGISVGGTNLVTGTSNELVDGSVPNGATWYFIAQGGNDHIRFDLSQYKGQYISGRVWIENPSADAWLQIWTNAGTSGSYVKGNIVKAGQSGYSSFEGWRVPDSFTDWNVPIGNGKPVTMKLKELKIEKGNRNTDWSSGMYDTQIGGDNLLPNSGKMYKMNDYSGGGFTTTTTTGERFSGDNFKKLVGECLPNPDVWVNLSLGETYTQSVEIETDGNLNSTIGYTWFISNQVGHQYVKAHVDKIGNNLYRVWSTYTHNTNKGFGLRVMDFSNFGTWNHNGTYLEFRHPKLERGNRPTAWTPSIDDQNGSGTNILKNSSTPNTPAKSSNWVDGGWRKAGNGGSKKEIWEYSDSILGDVYGFHIESGSTSGDVDYAQDSVPFKVGQVYTISAYAQGTGTLFLEAGPNSDNSWNIGTEKVGNTWKKYSYSFIANSSKMNVYFGTREANSVINIIGMKLEGGSQATTYNTGNWEISVNGLKSEFSKLDGNTVKYSSMEQTADGFKFTVGSGDKQKTIDLNTKDNILIGTSANWRRIPVHSSKDAWWHVSTSNTVKPLMIQFPQDTHFVYSIDVKNTTNKGVRAETIWCDANGARIANSGRQGEVIQPGATGTTMVKVPPKPNGAIYLEANIISVDGKATGEQELQLRNEKLEVGDDPTPWCASSQDRSGNLLTGSSNFDGFNVNSGNAVKDNWVDSNGNSAVKQPGVWNGYTKAIWLPRGTYTFSGQVYIQGNGLVSVYTNWARNKDSNAAIIYNQWANLPNVTDRWQKFVFQFEVSEQGNVYPRVESNTSNTTLHIGSFKVERGLHSDADWSDSPKSIESKTTNLQTQITAANQALESTNQALDSKVGKEEVFSTIKQTPDAIILTANDIELKSKTALKVGKITGKDLSIDLSNGAVDFKHGHIRGNLIDIDIDSNTIEGGTIKGTSILSNVTQQSLQNVNDIPQTSSEKVTGVPVHQINEFGQLYNGNVAIKMGFDSAIAMDGNDVLNEKETATVSFKMNVPWSGGSNKISDHLYVTVDTWSDPDIGEHFTDYTTYNYSTPNDKYTLIPIGVIKNYRFSFGFSLRLKAYLRGGNSTTATMVVWDAGARNRLSFDNNYRITNMSGDEISANDNFSTLIKSDITHYIGGAYSEFTSSVGDIGLNGKTVGVGLLVKMKSDVSLGICPVSFAANMVYKRGQNVAPAHAQQLVIDNFGNLDLSDRDGRFITMGSGSIKLSNKNVTNNITTIDGDGVRFNSSVSPQQKRIKFGGNWNNGGTDGVSLDSYGNIWADSDSWAWKIRDKKGQLAFQVPLISDGRSTGDSKFFARSERFFFQNETKDVYSPLAISWTSFGDIDGNRKYPVVALGSIWSDEYNIGMNNFGGFDHSGDPGSGIAFCSGRLVAFTKWKHAVIYNGW